MTMTKTIHEISNSNTPGIPDTCPSCGGTEIEWDFCEARITIEGHTPLDGLDWCWDFNDCANCGHRTYQIRLSISSHIEDEILWFDGCHKSESEHAVIIKSENYTVYGHECFNVTHDNPVSNPRFQTRFYKKFANYSFEKCSTQQDAIHAVGELFFAIIKDIRPDWFTPSNNDYQPGNTPSLRIEWQPLYYIENEITYPVLIEFPNCRVNSLNYSGESRIGSEYHLKTFLKKILTPMKKYLQQG